MRKKKRKVIPSRLWKHSMEGTELYLRCKVNGRWKNVGVATIKTASGHTAVRHIDLEDLPAEEHDAWMKALGEHWHSRHDHIESLLIIGDRKV